jgi:diguanylate cyclase (GGDEF)-like protein
MLTAFAAVLFRDRREVELAWWLLGGGLLALTCRGAVGYLPVSPASDAARIGLFIVGYGAALGASVRFIALRTNIRDLDGLIDGLILCCAVAVVLWEFVAHGHPGAQGALGSSTGMVLFPVLQALAVALAVRFMFWGTWRLTSAWLVFGGTLAVFAGNVGYVVMYDGDRGIPTGPVGALWLASVGLFLLAASHRSRGELTRAVLPGISRIPYARLTIMGAALIAAPAIVFEHARDYVAGTIPAVGSLLLTVMIIWRLFRLVIERESARGELAIRSEQQMALVSIGQRALAGSELARLFDEATTSVAKTLDVGFCGVFEPVGAETLGLRAAVGWPMSDAHRSTVRTAEPFFGVPLVSGSPGYLDLDRVGSTTGSELLLDEGIVSGVSVPIGTPSQRFGVLAVATTHARRFSADDVTFLRAVANVLTGSIERNRTEDEIRQAALHDALTGLPNRVLLLDRMESALSRANRQNTKVAVMFVDLDGFKQVNDTFGHRAGDQLLVAVSRRLQKVLRNEDTLARLSGDEFVVVCERVDDLEMIAAIANRIVATLSEAFVLDDGTTQISGSVGIAVGSGRDDDADGLLRDADTAMYRAKQKGKARYELHADEWITAQRLA